MSDLKTFENCFETENWKNRLAYAKQCNDWVKLL